MRRLQFLLLAILLLALQSSAANAWPSTLFRVSVATDGTEADANSGAPAISADGQIVGFESVATNIGPNSPFSAQDVYVHDVSTGVTELISVSSDGTAGNSLSGSPFMSADGNVIAFWSRASNLAPGDTNSSSDTFVRDRQAGTTERVSVASDGTEGDGHSFASSISADGQIVAFYSEASNLVANDTNNFCDTDFDSVFDDNCPDAFVHDRSTGTTERVSVSSGGAEGNAGSFSPVLSANGNFVVFHSDASNLVAGDTNGVSDVFLRDRQAGITERVSIAHDGAQANGPSLVSAVSADGNIIVFRSLASNLVPGDTNGAWDVFIRDRQAGTTERVSVASDGTQGNGNSFIQSNALSPDGRYVVFWSDAPNLVPNDTNGMRDVFLHDRVAASTTRVSVDSDGNEVAGHSDWPAVNDNGQFIAFASQAPGLVPEDTNNIWDVFLHDIGPCPAPTPWPFSLADSDCDGFTDDEEAFVGTDPNAWCPVDSSHDAWPADFNRDGVVDILDLSQMTPPAFGATTGNPNYTVRKDFNGDGAINILDMARLTPPMFGASCVPSP